MQSASSSMVHAQLAGMQPAARRPSQGCRGGGSGCRPARARWRALLVCASSGPPRAVVFDLGKVGRGREPLYRAMQLAGGCVPATTAASRCRHYPCPAPHQTQVLLDFDFAKSSQRLAAACRAPTPARQAALLELFGHAAQPTGLLDPWGGRSLVEQMERGALTSREFYQAVTEASGEGGVRGQRSRAAAGSVLVQTSCAACPTRTIELAPDPALTLLALPPCRPAGGLPNLQPAVCRHLPAAARDDCAAAAAVPSRVAHAPLQQLQRPAHRPLRVCVPLPFLLHQPSTELRGEGCPARFAGPCCVAPSLPPSGVLAGACQAHRR